MSDEPKGGAPRKLSTQEILAAARAAKAGGAAPAPTPPPAVADAPPTAEASPSVEAPVAEPAVPVAPKPAGAKPKSTADILAAARAAKAGAAAGGGEAAPAPKAAAAKPAAAAGAKPKSTADILAAARAGKAAAAQAAAPAAAAPAVAKAKPAAAAVAPNDDGGPKLSVEEMLAAVRPGTSAAAQSVAVAPAKPAGAPPMPAKPMPAAKAAKKTDDLRRVSLLAIVLSPFVLAWTLLTGTSLIAALAAARFMMPNVLIEPPRKFKIGPPSDYDLGTVATKLVAQYGVWIVHTDQYKGKNLIYALASVCTHLGCTPSWLAGEQKFKCPCHGSGFYITGVNFEGPAPRPLERVGIRISEDGMLEVDKSLKFQEEMGQWVDPASFYEVVG